MPVTGERKDAPVSPDAELLEQIADLRVEREIWAQELFETHRYTQSLVVNRQYLTEQLHAAIAVADQVRTSVAELQAEREALIAQRQTVEDHLSSARQLLIERTYTAETLSEENGRLRRREAELERQLAALG